MLWRIQPYASTRGAAVRIVEFEWDDANLAHLGEKGIEPEDVDAMLAARITVVKNKRERPGLYRFVGRGKGGRFLTVVVTRTADPGRWRPVTGWDSSQEERRRHGE